MGWALPRPALRGSAIGAGLGTLIGLFFAPGSADPPHHGPADADAALRECLATAPLTQNAPNTCDAALWARFVALEPGLAGTGMGEQFFAEWRLGAWRRETTRRYRALLATVDAQIAQDSDQEEYWRGVREALTASQKVWEAGVTAQCAVRAAGNVGAYGAVDEAACRADMLAARWLALDDMAGIWGEP